MRKIFILITSLMLTSCQFGSGKEEFVNPIFYEKMESLNDLWDVTITPKTFDMDNRHSDTWHEECDMWENREDKVVLRCTHQLDKEQLEMQALRAPVHPKTEEHNTYVIKFMSEEEQNSDEGIYSVIISYYEDETDLEFASKRGYFIRTPKVGVRIRR